MAVPDSPAMFSSQPFYTPHVTMYLAGCYILSSASSVADFIGPFGSLTYRHDEASATPDVGVDLDVGTWADAAEVPFNDGNVATYTGFNDAGVVTTDYGGGAATPGPYGDSRIGADDEILGASWLVRWYGGYFLFRYGDTPNGEAGVDNTTEVNLGIATFVKNHLIVSEAAGDVPTTDEYFQYGFKAVLAPRKPSPTMYDCLCSLLIKVASPAARGITLGKGLAGRDKNRNILVG